MPPGGRAQYLLLGPLEVESAAGSLTLDGARQRRLLAGLLVERGRALSTDLLCDVLWGECQPRHPDAALRSQIARLRQTLSAVAGAVRHDASGYRLDVPPDDVDTHRFEALVGASERANDHDAVDLLDNALRLWRGPVTIELSDCAFAQATVVRLEERRIAARVRRAELLLTLGGAVDAVEQLQQLMLECPSREHVRALLMQCLSVTGRHTEALDQYRSWRTELAEAGLEPSPELRRLEGEILRHTIEPTARRAHRRRQPMPQPASSFVGRADEIAEVRMRLARARLVTVVGPGGVGKTRLALAATAAGCDRESLAFADLAMINDPTLVSGRFADAIDLAGGGGHAPVASIVAALAERAMLLIVDNCEHLRDAVAELVDDLLAQCPTLTVLATSREPLGISGESVMRLDPLTGEDAAALFVDRATDGGARLALDRDCRCVDEICTRVDRLPLAVELAAKHADHLPLPRLLDLLDDRFRLLVDESPATPSRQRALEATLWWSYDLLDDDERHLLRHLAVLTGPFTIDTATFVAANANASDAVAAAQRLGALHRKSLVTFDHHTRRYRLLDTVRAFGLARLAELDEFDDAHRRMHDWLLDRAPGPWRYPFSSEANDQADADLDVLRGVLRWCRVAGRPASAAVLAASYGPLWFTTVRGSEALGWLVVEPDIDEQLELDTRLAWRTAAAYAAIGDVDVAWLRTIDDSLDLAPSGHPARSALLFARAWTYLQTDRARLRGELDSVRAAAGDDSCWMANCGLLDGLASLLDGQFSTAVDQLRDAATYRDWSGPSHIDLNLAVALHLAGRNDEMSAFVADLDLVRRTPTGFWGDVVGALVMVLEAVGRADVAAARISLSDMLAITAGRYALVRFADGFAVVAAGIIASAAGRPEDALSIFAGGRAHGLHQRYEGGRALAKAYRELCVARLPEPLADQASRRGQALTYQALIELVRREASSDASSA